MPCPWGTDTCKCLSMESIYGIDSMDSMISRIIEMIRDESSPIVKVNRSVEVMKNEISREPKIEPPERIRNPRMKLPAVSAAGSFI